jgi:hypothetical protein
MAREAERLRATELERWADPSASTSFAAVR